MTSSRKPKKSKRQLDVEKDIWITNAAPVEVASSIVGASVIVRKNEQSINVGSIVLALCLFVALPYWWIWRVNNRSAAFERIKSEQATISAEMHFEFGVSPTPTMVMTGVVNEPILVNPIGSITPTGATSTADTTPTGTAVVGPDGLIDSGGSGGSGGSLTINTAPPGLLPTLTRPPTMTPYPTYTLVPSLTLPATVQPTATGSGIKTPIETPTPTATKCGSGFGSPTPTATGTATASPTPTAVFICTPTITPAVTVQPRVTVYP